MSLELRNPGTGVQFVVNQYFATCAGYEKNILVFSCCSLSIRAVLPRTSPQKNISQTLTFQQEQELLIFMPCNVNDVNSNFQTFEVILVSSSVIKAVKLPFEVKKPSCRYIKNF